MPFDVQDGPPVSGKLGEPEAELAEVVSVEDVVDDEGVGVEVAFGVVAAAQVDEVIVSAVDVTVSLNAKALPVQLTVLPMVIPESSILVPAKVELAPSVVASPGVQKTSQADAPPARLTAELATVVSAP